MLSRKEGGDQLPVPSRGVTLCPSTMQLWICSATGSASGQRTAASGCRYGHFVTGLLKVYFKLMDESAQ
ncbi:MAG: hypothetical protein JXR76_30985 [Deltaproteobacteria bacterium]|nr:hypothetical protein [Deltaproteobacteria bacterium]